MNNIIDTPQIKPFLISLGEGKCIDLNRIAYCWPDGENLVRINHGTGNDPGNSWIRISLSDYKKYIEPWINKVNHQ